MHLIWAIIGQSSINEPPEGLSRKFAEQLRWWEAVKCVRLAAAMASAQALDAARSADLLSAIDRLHNSWPQAKLPEELTKLESQARAVPLIEQQRWAELWAGEGACSGFNPRTGAPDACVIEDDQAHVLRQEALFELVWRILETSDPKSIPMFLEASSKLPSPPLAPQVLRLRVANDMT